MSSSSVRRNSKSEWFPFGNLYCVACGQTFENGDQTLSGLYCASCSALKDVELRAQKREARSYDFHGACVKCGTDFTKDEPTLFGKYCEKCGKIWEKEKQIRQTQARLKKARNIPPAKTKVAPVAPKSIPKRKIYRNASILAYL